MQNDRIKKIQSNQKFMLLVRKKIALGWQLSFAMLAIYYGFILTLAFFPEILGQPVFSGSTMTVGIPVGIGIILSAFLLTGIYVYRANTNFDQLNQEIIEESRL